MRSSVATRRAVLSSLVQARNGKQWCLFIDRDGVINRQIIGGYVCSWDRFEFLPGALDALAVITNWAPRVVVVTNQQGVGKGSMTAGDLAEIHARMVGELAAQDVHVEAVLACPHLAESGCRCRKPQPGMPLEWLAAHPFVEGHLSVMLGDSDSDMDMARALSSVTGGCASIRIDPGLGSDGNSDATYGSLADFAGDVETVLEASTR